MPFLRFRFFAVSSTNDTALDLLEQQVPLPFVVRAEVQEAGQGRYGHTWYSPPGGLWFTLALERRPPRHFAWFTVLASEAVARALDDLGIPGVRIKVPNDLQFRGKKVGGLLGDLGRKAALLGVGINTRVPAFPASLQHRAGSLEHLTGRRISNDRLLDRILGYLNRLDQDLQQDRWHPWFQAWLQRLEHLGRPVRFQDLTTRQPVQGIFEGVTENFELRVDGRTYDLARIRDFRGVPEV